MTVGNGNQLEEKDNILFLYMNVAINWDFLEEPNRRYFQRILRDNPNLARTEYYGFPGSSVGMVLPISFCAQ